MLRGDSVFVEIRIYIELKNLYDKCQYIKELILEKDKDCVQAEVKKNHRRIT